jgi:pilus assembly protein CpaE
MAEHRPTAYISGLPAEVAAEVSDTLSKLGVNVQTSVNGHGFPPPEIPTGRVIVVLSPKGGSGKTAVASNLATVLARRHPGRVVAVDLDVQFGDLATALALRPTHNLAQLAQSVAIDSTSVKVALTPYEDNLYVLCASGDPADADMVKEAHVSTIIDLLARDFDYVVVDTAAGLDDHSLAAIEGASDVLLLSSMDVTSIRSARKAVDSLDRMHITTPRTFVLNRADAKVGLDLDDAAAAVGLPVACTIPSSRDVPLAMNVGKPVVETEPRSVIAKQFEQLANLFDAPVDAEPKRRWRK